MTAAADSPLISVGELADALAGPVPPTLIDVRWRLGGPPGIEAYRAGHLPGAIYVDLDTQLPARPDLPAATRCRTPPSSRPPCALPASWPMAMWLCTTRRMRPSRRGRGGCCGTSGTACAGTARQARARPLGHGRVRVLDGGYQAWRAAGQPVSTEDETAAPGDFTASPGHLQVLDAAGAAEVARTGILLDARAPARYRGETEPVDRVAGHIPGALSAPTAANVASDGLFRSAAELRARFADLGIDAAARADSANGAEPNGADARPGLVPAATGSKSARTAARASLPRTRSSRSS